MHRCCHCHSPFGLVSHRFLFKHFCSLKCVGVYKRNRAAAIKERVSRWCSVVLTSMAFGKSRSADIRGQRRYVSVPHRAFHPLRRHP